MNTHYTCQAFLLYNYNLLIIHLSLICLQEGEDSDPGNSSGSHSIGNNESGENSDISGEQNVI